MVANQKKICLINFIHQSLYNLKKKHIYCGYLLELPGRANSVVYLHYNVS